MNIKISALLFFLLVPGNIFSQSDFLDELTNWVGEWESTFTINNDKEAENLTISFAHNYQFLQMEIKGKSLTVSDAYWSSTAFFTLDHDLKIVGWEVNSNGLEGMTTIKGMFDKNKLYLEYKCQLYKDKLTWERRDGKIFRIYGESKNKETGETIPGGEAVFTRKN